MATVFVIRNQYGHYLGKHSDWLDGSDKRLLYRTSHRDEAVNMVFEQSSKDISLRASPLECELDSSNNPKVEAGPEIMVESANDAEADANSVETSTTSREES